MRNFRLPGPAVGRTQGLVINPDFTRGRSEEAEDQVNQRALTAASLADEADPCALGNSQGNITQDQRAVGRITEIHVVKRDRGLKSQRRAILGGRRVRSGLSQQVENVVERRLAGQDLGPTTIDLLKQW